MERVEEIGHDHFIVSGLSKFTEDDIKMLNAGELNFSELVTRLYPEHLEFYEQVFF